MNTYEKRRQNLGDTFNETLFLIASGNEFSRSHSVKYNFKVASDFLYLTGLHLTDSILLVLKNEALLFTDQLQDDHWGEKSVLTVEDSEKIQNLRIISRSQFKNIIYDYYNKYQRLAASIGRDHDLDHNLLQFLNYNRQKRGRIHEKMTLCDSTVLVGHIRNIKSTDEIQNMRMAAQKSSLAFTDILKTTVIGQSEKQVRNQIESLFLKHDLAWTSFQTIVGSGHRSTILHARASDKIIQKDDHVLIDAGAEWNNYCADITRVFPAGKQFSSSQKKIYQAVLDVQKNIISLIKPGLAFSELQQNAIIMLQESVQNLGIKLSDEDKQKNKLSLFPHNVSHWIGMDVHDPAMTIDDAGHPIRLTSGMTLTVEPGLYFRQDLNFNIDDYNGIGIRIEDDVLVTDSGHEVLTTVAKELEHIEQLRHSQS